MKYLDYTHYRAIYAKYINRENLLGMMDLVKDYKNKTFLDLCCGDGAAAREAFKRGAKDCCMIDSDSSMLAPDLYDIHKNSYREHIIFELFSIEEFLKNKEKCINFDGTKEFDIVFCRQGINYWYKPNLMNDLSKVMKRNGIFIFNTFNKKPSNFPMVKEYQIDGVEFVEVSNLVGEDTVHHVQIGEGYPPHLTKFKWIPEYEFDDGLKKYFDYEIRRKKNTDVYICRKK